jgi:hypothetical protein
VATDVSICSAALSLLGDKPISSLSEANRTAATLCSNIYPMAKREVMRAHPWNCLVTRVILSPLTTTPAFEWGYQFALPGDCLRILAVGYDGQPEDYRVEGRRILARTSVLRFQYVAELGEGYWDALLVETMTKRMVKDLAYPITKSTSLAEAKAREFEIAFKRAKAVDGQENPPEDWNDSPFISVRGGASF